MSTVYAVLFMCVVLSIAAFASLRIGRAAGSYDAEVEHEYSQAILTKRA